VLSSGNGHGYANTKMHSKKNKQTNQTYHKDDWGLQLFHFPLKNQGEKNGTSPSS
jgi:hypothetical protein